MLMVTMHVTNCIFFIEIQTSQRVCFVELFTWFAGRRSKKGRTQHAMRKYGSTQGGGGGLHYNYIVLLN